jgi:PAS domain S-box-containing protein
MGALALNTHQKARDQAAWITQDLARSYALLSNHLIDDIDRLLLGITRDWAQETAEQHFDNLSTLHEYGLYRHLKGLLLLDANGSVIASSGIKDLKELSHRPFYRIHLEPEAPRRHIETPRPDHRHFNISRSIRDGAGRLQAVVVALLDIDTLHERYEQLLNHPLVSTALLDHQGHFVVRVPTIERPLSGESAPSTQGLSLPLEAATTLLLPRSVDMRRRLITLYPLEKYPLTVAATLDLDGYMGQWWQRTWKSALLWLGLSTLAWWGARWLLMLLHDRKSARTGLVEQQRLKATLINEASDAIVIFDTAGRIALANPAAHRLYGYEPEALIGRLGIELVHPDYRALFQQFLTLKEGEIFETESLDRHQTGRFFHTEIHGRALNEDGQRRLLAVVRDITNRKEKEHKSEARHQLEVILREIATTLVSCRSEELDDSIKGALGSIGRFTGADRSYLFLFDEDRAYISNTHEWCAPDVAPQQMHLQHISADLFPWWLERLNRLEPISLNTLSELPPEAKQERQMLEEQDIRSLLVLPIHLLDRPIGFIGFDIVQKERIWSDEDVTATRMLATLFAGAIDRIRREQALTISEMRFRMAAQKSGQLIYEYDPATGHIEWAGAIQAVTGSTPEQFAAVDLRGWEALIHPDDRQRVMDILFQAESFGGGFDSEYRLQHRAGHYIHVEEHGSFYTDQHGKKRMIGAINDITDRINAYRELERMAHTLEDQIRREVNRRMEVEAQKHDQERLLIQQSKMAAMGEMIGAIAHQWRQPLNALGLFIQDLKDAWQYGELDKSYIEQMVNKSMRQINFMSKTIDDFKRFFKPNKQARSFLVASAIENVQQLVSAQLRDHNITLRCTIENEQQEVTGHESEFEQVVLNLISNAKDALIERNIPNPQITIHIQRADDMLVLWVEDNAGGIDPEIIERIYEPYFTTKEEGKGTGIGLYMSKMIIEESMKGSLMATNTAKGARMVITLPLKSADEN